MAKNNSKNRNVAAKRTTFVSGVATPPEPTVETPRPDEDGELTPPDELAEQVDKVVNDNKDLKAQIEALKPEPKVVNLDLKTLAEIVNKNAELNQDGDDPAYVTGDGFVFPAERYSNALEHVRNRPGLKLHHVVKAEKGWRVKP